MIKSEKTVVIDALTQDFKDHETLFIADYRGLDVGQINGLRNQLRDSGASFKVVKNTLARIAAQNAGYDDLVEHLQGPSSITFVHGDAAAVAKILRAVHKETQVLEVRAGLMDGRAVDASQVKEIADLPPREQILAMLVGAVNAPLTQTVGVLNAPLRDIVGVLNAQIEKLGGEGAA